MFLAGAVVVAFLPRRKSPLQLAALTGALLIAFEIVLTHWFYLYIVWFFPLMLVALAMLERTEEPAPDDALPDPRYGTPLSALDSRRFFRHSPRPYG